MAKIGTADIEVHYRLHVDDWVFALGFWHLCLASGLVVGLLLGALR